MCLCLTRSIRSAHVRRFEGSRKLNCEESQDQLAELIGTGRISRTPQSKSVRRLQRKSASLYRFAEKFGSRSESLGGSEDWSESAWTTRTRRRGWIARECAFESSLTGTSHQRRLCVKGNHRILLRVQNARVAEIERRPKRKSVCKGCCEAEMEGCVRLSGYAGDTWSKPMSKVSKAKQVVKCNRSRSPP